MAPTGFTPLRWPISRDRPPALSTASYARLTGGSACPTNLVFRLCPPGYPRVALRFHDAGGLAQSAVPALAVRVVPRRPVGARHLALVESDQGALVVF